MIIRERVGATHVHNNARCALEGNCAFRIPQWNSRCLSLRKEWLQVSKVEFMMFILENLNLVGRDEMGKILELFESVDRIGDGVLTIRVPPWPSRCFKLPSCILRIRMLQMLQWPTDRGAVHKYEKEQGFEC